jgi:hypothetical protein
VGHSGRSQSSCYFHTHSTPQLYWLQSTANTAEEYRKYDDNNFTDFIKNAPLKSGAVRELNGSVSRVPNDIFVTLADDPTTVAAATSLSQMAKSVTYETLSSGPSTA